MSRLNYKSKIVGVTFEGRQDTIKGINKGTPIRVRREADNEFDPQAVAVDAQAGEDWLPIGYIAKDKNKDIAESMDAGKEVRIRIASLTGGDRDKKGKVKSYGVNIELDYEKAEKKPVEVTEIDYRAMLQEALVGMGVIDLPAETTLYRSRLLGKSIEVSIKDGHVSLPGFMSGSKFPQQFYQPFPDGIRKMMAEKFEVDEEHIQAMWDLQGLASTSFGNAVHAAMENFDRHRKLGDKLKSVKKYKTKPDLVGPNKALSKNAFIKKIVEDFDNSFGGDYVRLNEEFIWDLDKELCGSIDRVKVIDADKRIIRIQDFKGLELNTPIPTPFGFVKMKDLKVGDIVFDKDGKQVKVKNKSSVHHRECYRITLEDGSSLISDNEHRWWASSGRSGSNNRIITSDEMFDLKSRGETVRIPTQGAIDVVPSELPVDPYVLGVWLADGNSHCGMITAHVDARVFDEIVSRGYSLGSDTDRRDNIQAKTVLGLSAKLKELGVLKNKHIPDSYLMSSYGQRLDLLRGLMDGDGSWNRTRQLAVMTTIFDL